MILGIRNNFLLTCLVVLCSYVFFIYIDSVFGGEVAPQPEMPRHWKVISDFQVPPKQVKYMGSKLDADLSAVRNTVYNVNGKRVQINVIVTPDKNNAEKLMTRLRSMKIQEAVLRKGLTVYEFVGQNDVLSLIAEGRKYLDLR